MTIRLAPGTQANAIAQPPCVDLGPDQWVERGRLPGILDERRNVLGHDRIARSYRNGCYQHLLFLGICGFVNINHIDHEIVLIDPWPTYHSYWTKVNFLQGIYRGPARRPLTDQSTQGKDRIASLASFLRHAVQMGYHLSGVLLSHMHFDHADDIVLLLELLVADNPGGAYFDHTGRIMHLSGPRIENVDELPKIYCDYDSIIYLQTYGLYVDYRAIDIDGNEEFVPRRARRHQRYWYHNEALRDILDKRLSDAEDDPSHFTNSDNDAWQVVKQRYIISPPPEPGPQNIVSNDAWQEISANNGQRLHFDDSYNDYLDDPARQCRAGTPCDLLVLGNFNVTPYVWDHLNTGTHRMSRESQREQAAGRFQRLSAFMIQHADAPDAKRTFIVGSSGEMNANWTSAMVQNMRIIETDLLIHAITPPIASVIDFHDQIRAYMEFMVRKITIHEALVFVHFEEFVRRVADEQEYLECFDRTVTHNFNVLREMIRILERAGDARYEKYSELFEKNRIFILARHGAEFECVMPPDPEHFKDLSDTNPLPPFRNDNGD